MVPNGNVKKLQRMSTKSLSASANKTLLVSVFTRSFKDTTCSLGYNRRTVMNLMIAAMKQENKRERKERSMMRLKIQIQWSIM